MRLLPLCNNQWSIFHSKMLINYNKTIIWATLKEDTFYQQFWRIGSRALVLQWGLYYIMTS